MSVLNENISTSSFYSPDSEFFFFVPMDEIFKAKNDEGEEEMRIKGVASTSDEDAEEEELDVNGFDFQPFLKSGYFNFHHQAGKDPLANIGEPTNAYVKDNKFYVEGFLYKDNALAKKVFEFAKVLKANSKTRKMGFSIEGKRKKLDPTNPKRVLESVITHVAITHAPINSNTLMDIVKSNFHSDPPAFDFDEIIEKSETNEEGRKANGGSTEYLLEMDMPDGRQMIITKSGCVKIIKKMDMTEYSKQVPLDLGKKEEKVIPETEVRKRKKIVKSEEVFNLIKSDYPDMDDSEISVVAELCLAINQKTFNMSKFLNTDALNKAYDALGIKKGDSTTEPVVVPAEPVAEPVVETPVAESTTATEGFVPSTFSEPVVETAAATTEPAVEEVDLDELVKGIVEKTNAAFDAKFEAVLNVMKGFAEGFSKIEQKFDELESQPQQQRKSVVNIAKGLQILEKGWGVEIKKGGEVSDKKVISKGDKSEILSMLDKATFKNGGFDEVMANAMIAFENRSELSPEIQKVLEEEYKVEIQ